MATHWSWSTVSAHRHPWSGSKRTRKKTLLLGVGELGVVQKQGWSVEVTLVERGL